jgi:hypothetical protein
MCVSYPLWPVFSEIYKPEVDMQIIVDMSPCGCIYHWNLQILNNLIILTDKVSLVPRWHPAHCRVYSIQHYVIKLVSDLRQVGGISPVSYTNNTNHHDIT